MEVSRMLATPIEGTWAESPTTPTKTPPRFEIDIHSDVVCPFCYIGKKYLDRAIALYQEQNPDAEFIVRWRPVILYPDMRPSGAFLVVCRSSCVFLDLLFPRPPLRSAVSGKGVVNTADFLGITKKKPPHTDFHGPLHYSLPLRFSPFYFVFPCQASAGK